jgi:hypothetical protein
MKIFKKLSTLLLILSFQLSLKGQSESSFNTINFKILTNLKENEKFEIRVVIDFNSIGRFAFIKKESIIYISLFSDANYDILEDVIVKGISDSLIYTTILNQEDIYFFENAIKNCFLESYKTPNCSPPSYLMFYLDDKYLQRIRLCSADNQLFERFRKLVKK